MGATLTDLQKRQLQSVVSQKIGEGKLTPGLPVFQKLRDLGLITPAQAVASFPDDADEEDIKNYLRAGEAMRLPGYSFDIDEKKIDELLQLRKASIEAGQRVIKHSRAGLDILAKDTPLPTSKQRTSEMLLKGVSTGGDIDEETFNKTLTRFHIDKSTFTNLLSTFKTPEEIRDAVINKTPIQVKDKHITVDIELGTELLKMLFPDKFTD